MSDDFSRDLMLKGPATLWGNHSIGCRASFYLSCYEGGSVLPYSALLLDKNRGLPYDQSLKKREKTRPLTGFFHFFSLFWVPRAGSHIQNAKNTKKQPKLTFFFGIFHHLNNPLSLFLEFCHLGWWKLNFLTWGLRPFFYVFFDVFCSKKKVTFFTVFSCFWTIFLKTEKSKFQQKKPQYGSKTHFFYFFSLFFHFKFLTHFPKID
jgi:hypothetical protein